MKNLTNEHANQQAYLRQQVTLLEDKNLRVLKEQEKLSEIIEQKDREISDG